MYLQYIYFHHYSIIISRLYLDYILELSRKLQVPSLSSNFPGIIYNIIYNIYNKQGFL